MLLLIALCAEACGLAPRMARPAGMSDEEARALRPASVGYANGGILLAGVPLPETGPGFVRAKTGEDTRWGAPVLRDAIERAARKVARSLPGGAPLVVGDLSARYGGLHSRHGSHQTGRDVDVLFYLIDVDGRPRRGSGF
ncbi:MAG TPA: penicillin-insensitive murein endopeptidase, partial [Polyangiales bacterium]